MSAGQGGRGGSFARRGSSSKKLKHRKQDFHEHRVRLSESESPPDFQTVRDRTLQSLDRLGHQAFPPDSSYGIQGWTKSLGVLLDDFETSASSMLALPESYSARRKSVMETLSKGFAFPEMDDAVARGREEVARISSEMGNRDAAYFGSRLAALRAKRERLGAELEAENASISRIKSERSGRLFQRILGQKPPSTDEMEAHAGALSKEIDDSNAQETALQAEELHFDGLKRELAAANDRLAELEAKKTERLQLAPEREEAARMLADEISKILPPQA